jgi:hypothetical protein
MRTHILAASTVLLLVSVGATSALVGACSASPGDSNDASVDAPVCNPDSGDPLGGCPCDPTTFVNGSTCYTGPPGTEAKGICQTGKRSCNNGMYSACVGEVLPQPEVCDYADNDCDGIVDDLPAIIEAGAIASCNSPACDPNYADAAITCWGPDLGICGAGTLTCTGGMHGGTPTGCNEYIHAGVPEVCNGFDDDCNGIIDDGLTMDGPCTMPDGSMWAPDANPFDGGQPSTILGACLNGNLTCIDSNCNQHTCADAGDQCFPSQPAAETCNGIDDNCNGVVDDHACSGQFYTCCCNSGTFYDCLPCDYTMYGYTCRDAG